MTDSYTFCLLFILAVFAIEFLLRVVLGWRHDD